MTQAQFDRIVFAVNNMYTKDIAESTIKALAEMVDEWGKFKRAEAEKANAPADALEEVANEGE